MEIKRNCSTNKLSKQPLALVLIQIRFSPFLNMSQYVPKIQDNLRKIGFVEYEEIQGLEFKVSPNGIQSVENKCHVFKTQDQYSNVILDSSQLVYQTSDYDVFEVYYSKFTEIISSVVNEIPDFKSTVSIQRLGLRYVDRIIPMDTNDQIDTYIKKDFQIKQASVFGDQEKICSVSQAGQVPVGVDKTGVIVLRLTQGEKGLVLPPDLMAQAPKLKRELNKNNLIGLIDIDHFYKPKEKLNWLNNDILEEVFYKMHDNSKNMFEDVVSPEGIEKWK